MSHHFLISITELSKEIILPLNYNSRVVSDRQEVIMAQK